MKKSFRIVALALVLVAMVACLASCGGPAKDPDDAVAALKDADYVAAQDTMVIPTALKILGVKGVDSVVTGTKVEDDKTNHVTVVYFEDKDAANDAWEKVQEYAEDEKDEDDSDWSIKKSGAMIWWGTSDAVKAAK